MKKLISLLLLVISSHAFDYGSMYFDGNCIGCHHKTKEGSAPSIKNIKKHYINAFPVKEDFVQYMSTWVYRPKAETSLMQEEVNKYGVMPDLLYDLDTLEKISSFIYDTKF